MLKYDFSGVLFGEILDVSRVTWQQRGFTTVSFCVGILNDRLDPTPSPGVRLQPGRTSFRSSSKNAVIGGISSLDTETDGQDRQDRHNPHTPHTPEWTNS